MINVFRVRARVEVGGHDVPEEKIISRYDKALALLKDVVCVCDICHIYDNSEDRPYRIYKKRKEESFFNACDDWTKEDIFLLTQDQDAKSRDSAVNMFLRSAINHDGIPFEVKRPAPNAETRVALDEYEEMKKESGQL